MVEYDAKSVPQFDHKQAIGVSIGLTYRQASYFFFKFSLFYSNKKLRRRATRGSICSPRKFQNIA